MCNHENCERHEYDYGLCLPHLKEKFSLVSFEVAKPKRKSRKKKVDAVEVETTDAPVEIEERSSEDNSSDE